MPPPGYEPFLAAIIAAPDDDLPRLVYADWLDEHGDSDRAEFIRVQCELAPLSPSDARFERFDIRSKHLWSLNKACWLGELPRVPGVFWEEDLLPVRGFRDVLVLTDVRAFLPHAGEVAAAAPFERVILGTAWGQRDWADRRPEVRQAALAEQDRWLADLAALVRSEFFRRVRVLRMDRLWLGASLTTALTALRPGNRLEEFLAGGWLLTDEDARALMASPGLASLRLLGAPIGRLSPDVAAELLRRFEVPWGYHPQSGWRASR